MKWLTESTLRCFQARVALSSQQIVSLVLVSGTSCTNRDLRGTGNAKRSKFSDAKWLLPLKSLSSDSMFGIGYASRFVAPFTGCKSIVIQNISSESLGTTCRGAAYHEACRLESDSLFCIGWYCNNSGIYTVTASTSCLLALSGFNLSSSTIFIGGLQTDPELPIGMRKTSWYCSSTRRKSPFASLDAPFAWLPQHARLFPY